jgi:hypothetical protein
MTEQRDYSPGTKHAFIAPDSPGLSTRITLKDEDGNNVRVKIRFKNGRYEADGPVAKVLDACLAKDGSALGRESVRRVDMAQAAAIADAHAARLRGAAMRGTTHTGHLSEMRGNVAAGSAKTLAEVAPNNPEGLEQFTQELAGDNIVITEETNKDIPHADVAPPTQESIPSPLGKLKI